MGLAMVPQPPAASQRSWLPTLLYCPAGRQNIPRLLLTAGIDRWSPPVIRRPLPALALSALAAIIACPVAFGAADPGATLHQLFDLEWERGLREDPTLATYLGDHRYDNQWPDRSPTALERSHQADQAVLDTLGGIAPESLTEAEQLNRELFRRLYQGSVDAYAYGSRFTPVSQKNGAATAHQLAELINFSTARDYEDWLARLGGPGRVVDTGMHYSHWIREQAIDFFKANAAKTELDVMEANVRLWMAGVPR